MFKNVLKTALRTILRNKIYSVINLLSLAIGIACSLLILLWVWNEINFDKFHEKLDHLFIVQQEMNLGTGEYTTDRSGGAYASAILEGFPEVTNTCRISTTGELLLSVMPQNDTGTNIAGSTEEKKFIEDLVIAADSTFFEMFSFRLIKGDPESVLKYPYTMVLTQKMAEKYFGKQDPLGQIIRINRAFDFTVTGIVDEFPDNSTINFDFLVPFPFLADLGWSINEYGGNPFFTFLFIDNPDNHKKISDQLPDFFSTLFESDVEAVQKLLPFSKMHFFGESPVLYAVLVFSLLAFLILIIACINFMNLSTARFLNRTKEVGIRKVVGASRRHLIRQFIGETIIMAFVAMNLGILAVDFIIPRFNSFFHTELSLEFTDPVLYIILIALTLITGFIAGSYPALFLSSFKPVDVLRKTMISRSKGGWMRKTLVIVQFIFSIIFIIGTIVIFRQFNYLQTSNLGVNRENIIYFPVRGDLEDNYGYVKSELLSNPDILSVTTGSHVPVYADLGEVEWGLESDDKNDLARILWVGYDFAKTFDINLTLGRFYSTDHSSDSIDKIIVNEATVKTLGLETPIGETFYLYDDPYIIIGVVENFISFPVKLAGENLILPFDRVGNFIFIKTTGKNPAKTLHYIEKVHEKFNPDFPFIYVHMDGYMDPISDAMRSVGKIIFYFTLFGIFISCLGLFGLSTFATEQKTKEIGIRKAMGANMSRILLLMNKEFLKLVIIAFMIALPLSVVVSNLLLKGFSRRIELNPMIFINTGLLILGISLVTILYQSLRSATRNPADSLRYE